MSAPPAADGAPRLTASTCCYCGVGCGVLIESDAPALAGGRITGVRGDPAHPANHGRLCSKGSTLHLSASASVASQARLLRPLWRAQRGAAPAPLGWDEALERAADRLAAIAARDGPGALGFYVSGQFLTEDYYVFHKLARGLLQTPHIDSNSRLCMSSAVAGYKRTLGADAPPACYEDIERARTLFLAGSNAAWAHPVLFRRIEEARRANPALRIIVADPRRTDTAELADLHLPLAPGSDIALFHGMLHVLLWDGMVDTAFIERHTSGFEALRVRVREFTPREAARLCGLDEADIVRAAHWFGGRIEGGSGPGATLSLYCQGLNQSADGSAKNAALINLHLATGQIGRPGAGPFSLTGQPNAMGGREVGAMATLLSAHRDPADPQDRAAVARLWGLAGLPEGPGLSAVGLFEAAAAGRIKALWIACTNPAQSMPDQALVRAALERAEFVVLQEAFAGTATAAYADLQLPAAAWGEKEGTVTNSERRISRVRAAVLPPGQARPDWRIGVDLARRLEARLRPGLPTLFPYEDPESVWNEHRESTRGRDLDITGLSWDRLEREGPQQWPCPAGAPAGRARLYEDGRFAHADGRARFADVPLRPLAEPRDARYPYSLITGRLRDQWHGMSRTGTVPQLFGHAPEPAVELHPADLRALGLAEGDLAHVTSRRGSIVLPARAGPGLARTQAYIAMHWGSEFLGGRASAGAPLAGINALTTRSACPDSRQPELKHAAVKILPAPMPWRLLAMRRLGIERLLRTQAALRELLGEFPFATCVPVAGAVPGLLFRAAGHEAPAAPVLGQIEQLLGLDVPQVLRYADARRGQRRAMLLEADPGAAGAEPQLAGFLLAGDTTSETWVRELFLQGGPARPYGRQLLRPGAAAPRELAASGPQVCSCLGVSLARIRAHLESHPGSDEERLAALQRDLRCGTNCGSCLPELRRLVREPAPAA